MPRGRVMTRAEASKDEPPGQQRGTSSDSASSSAVDVSMVDEHASYLGSVSFYGRPDIQLHKSDKVRHLVDFGNVFIFVVWSSEPLLLIMAMSNMRYSGIALHVYIEDI